MTMTDEIKCAQCDDLFQKQDMLHYNEEYFCAECKPDVVRRLKEGVDLPQNKTMEYSGFWRRSGASLLDLVFFSPLTALSFYNTYSLKSITVLIAVSVLYFTYKIYFETTRGGTWGKLLLKIKIVGGDNNPLSLNSVLLRNSPWIIMNIITLVISIQLHLTPEFQNATTLTAVGELQQSSMTQMGLSIVYGISCIVCAFTAQKQTLHDMFAKAYCVKFTK